MAKSKPRVKAPKTAQAGEVVTIKTLISHKMESGMRKDKKTKELIPRKIINHFKCLANGAEVFSAEIGPAISANPYFQFTVLIEAETKLDMIWTEDGGAEFTTSKTVKIA